MRLRITALITLQVIWAPIAAAQNQEKPSSGPNPLEYVVNRLQGMEGKALPTDILEGRVLQQVRPSVSDVSSSGKCTLGFSVWAIFSGPEIAALEAYRINVDLAKAELNGAAPLRDRVTLRIIDPIIAEVVRVVSGKSVDALPANLKDQLSQKSTQRFSQISLPAQDEEDARRVSRALNEQIRLCGGRPDPFAK